MGAAKQAMAKPVRRARPFLKGCSANSQASTAISPAATRDSTKVLALMLAASASTGSTAHLGPPVLRSASHSATAPPSARPAGTSP